jgi:hypothetical protein
VGRVVVLGRRPDQGRRRLRQGEREGHRDERAEELATGEVTGLVAVQHHLEFVEHAMLLSVFTQKGW